MVQFLNNICLPVGISKEIYIILTHCHHIFSVAVCLRCLLHHMDLQIVFVCLYITPFHYHHCANVSKSIALMRRLSDTFCCPACRNSLIATRFWVVMICPIIKCLTVLEFSFILFDLCLFITIFNFILNYVPIITFWIFTYHKIWILLIIFCFIWSYWIIYFLTCLEVFWSVVS